MVDVFPNDQAYVSARIESDGINAVRELRFQESLLKLEITSKNTGYIEDRLKNRINTPNRFRPRSNWIDPMQLGPVGPLMVDDVTSDHFKLTPDGKGIWNAYYEKNDDGENARVSLRLLHPITGKVLKQLPSVESYYLDSCYFDRECRFAITQTRTTKEIAAELSTFGVTCWNLEKGTIAWKAEPPKDVTARVEYTLKTARTRDPVLGGARDKVFVSVWIPDGVKTVRGGICNPFSKDEPVSKHWQAAL